MIVLYRYLLIINGVTFLLRGRDKRQAIHKGRRVSERQLLLLTAMGGGAGAYLGMQMRRHKTLKGSFLWKFRSILGCWILLVLRVMDGGAYIADINQ